MRHSRQEGAMSMGSVQHGVSPMGNSGSLTRRGLVRAAAAVAAAAAMPRPVWAASEEISPVMAKLSTYMSEAGSRALPDQVVQETKYHILDTLAAMISGSELPPGVQALRFARAYSGGRTATVVASDILGGPI